MDVAIYFNNQPCPMTIKIDNESLNNLLPPKMNSQFVRPKFLPQDLLSRCHLTPQFPGALEFRLGDSLTRDDVFDWHEMILIQNPTPASPKGEELIPTWNKILLWKLDMPSDRKEVNLIPSPFGEGQADTPINLAGQGEVQTNPSPVYHSATLGYDVPQGEEAMCSSNKILTWETVTTINRPAPVPLGKDRLDLTTQAVCLILPRLFPEALIHVPTQAIFHRS
ncbi:MAG TPA: hypothetical protein VKP08_07065, partial [Anaerolineales bacterium]|nr:hypothetical protein [Anaerolineales bacterium]